MENIDSMKTHVHADQAAVIAWHTRHLAVVIVNTTMHGDIADCLIVLVLVIVG